MGNADYLPRSGKVLNANDEERQQFDRITGAAKAITIGHEQIHQGKVFSVTRLPSIANGASHYLTLTVPDETYVHFQEIRLNSDGPKIKLELFEGPTITAATGTAVTPVNRRRMGTPSLSALTVLSAPTVTVDGTLIETDYIGGGTGVGGTSSGGSTGNPHEFVLKPGTDYGIKITNGGTASAAVMIGLLWYEEPEG